MVRAALILVPATNQVFINQKVSGSYKGVRVACQTYQQDGLLNYGTVFVQPILIVSPGV